MAHPSPSPPAEFAARPLLDARLWRGALSALAIDAETAPTAMESALIGEAQALLELAPPGALANDATLPDPRRMAAMQRAGAGVSAVLALMPRMAHFILSQGDDACVASIILDTEADEVTRRGASPALALTAALASALAGEGRSRMPPRVKPGSDGWNRARLH